MILEFDFGRSENDKASLLPSAVKRFVSDFNLNNEGLALMERFY
jgi:hypothetical protein